MSNNFSDISVDPSTGDLDLNGAQLNKVEGGEAVAQEIRIGLRLFQGEWFLDQRVGMPYFQSIFVKNPNINLLRDLFRRAIKSVPGVTTVDRMVMGLDAATRTLDVSFTCQTAVGDIPLEFKEAFVLPQVVGAA